MYDILPFPNINAPTTKEQVVQIQDYLIQFKETLEFVLSNISIENLSQDIIEKLNKLSTDIERSVEDRDDQLQQVSNNSLTISDVVNSELLKNEIANNTLTIDDVVNSQDFKTEVENAVTEKFSTTINFSINFEDGNLYYLTEDTLEGDV